MIGEPYTSFPVESFVWGHGGVVGWGTMCGTMLGAAVAANLIAGPGVNKTGERITNEVIHYYSKQSCHFISQRIQRQPERS